MMPASYEVIGEAADVTYSLGEGLTICTFDGWIPNVETAERPSRKPLAVRADDAFGG